ncbi:MAG: hypothetical protein JM58_09055 [Peptococcaceae bacterium BICA1-8]|nr:MAG: hypothetical protein JM58_09055 [Peptococcaceae bacterium BICA1-8]
MILIVDDEINIRVALHEYLVSEGYQCQSAAGAQEALDLLETNKRIKVVLCDLKMPKMNGLDLIKYYKKKNPDSFIKFIMITGFKDTNTMRLGFKEGVVDYLFKPVTLEEIKAVVDNALEKYEILEKEWLEMEKKDKRLNQFQVLIKKKHLDMIQLMMNMIQARDAYTEEHCKKVSEMVGILSNKMNLRIEQVAKFKLASLLHDVGKIAVSDTILLKPGPLTPEEFEQIKLHSIKGYDIVKEYVDSEVASLILHHHEYYNGKGYPLGLKDYGIPLGARIISVCDQYDAIRSSRPYREVLSQEEAIKIMIADTGIKFDKNIVDIFLGEVDKIEATLYENKTTEKIVVG